jgi:hypothetical protein
MPAGFVAVLTGILYAPVRFFLDFLRPETSDPRYVGLTFAQWASILAFGVSVFVAGRLLRNGKPAEMIAPTSREAQDKLRVVLKETEEAEEAEKKAKGKAKGKAKDAGKKEASKRAASEDSAAERDEAEDKADKAAEDKADKAAEDKADKAAEDKAAEDKAAERDEDEDAEAASKPAEAASKPAGKPSQGKKGGGGKGKNK